MSSSTSLGEVDGEELCACMSTCVYVQELVRMSKLILLFVHLCAPACFHNVCVEAIERVALGFSSPLSRSWVYHGGLPWQPQKWPVRALGNVDVQIMTC